VRAASTRLPVRTFDAKVRTAPPKGGVAGSERLFQSERARRWAMKRLVLTSTLMLADVLDEATGGERRTWPSEAGPTHSRF
jgi:hypothetical protein